MADTAAAVIADTLIRHSHVEPRHLNGRFYPRGCSCGLTDAAIGFGARWYEHQADAIVAALAQAGHLPVNPVVTRTDHTAEATWRAAALTIVAAWTHNPIPEVDVTAIQQDDVRHRWPTLGAAIDRLVRAKQALLEDR